MRAQKKGETVNKKSKKVKTSKTDGDKNIWI